MSASETDDGPDSNSEGVHILVDGGQLLSLLEFVGQIGDDVPAILVVEDESLRIHALDPAYTFGVRTREIDVYAEADVAVRIPPTELKNAIEFSVVDPTLVIDEDESTMTVKRTALSDQPIEIREPGELYKPDTEPYHEQYRDVQATVTAWRFIGAAKAVAGPAHNDVRLSACASDIKLEGNDCHATEDETEEGWPVSLMVDAEYGERPQSVRETETRWGASIIASAVDVLPCGPDLDLELYWSPWSPLSMLADGVRVSVAPRRKEAYQDPDAGEGADGE